MKGAWDFHAVSSNVMTLPEWGYQGQQYRGGSALLTLNTMRFSITMHSSSGVVNKSKGDNCTSLDTRGNDHGSSVPAPDGHLFFVVLFLQP